MTRGKYAAKATNRRADEATAEIQQLKETIAAERETHREQLTELKVELSLYRAEFTQRVAEQAGREIAAAKENANQEIHQLAEDHRERAQQALRLIEDWAYPSQTQLVADILGGSMAEVEAERFLNRPEGRVPNRKVKRAVARINDQKNRTFIEAGEVEARLGCRKGADGLTGPSRAGGKFGHV